MSAAEPLASEVLTAGVACCVKSCKLAAAKLRILPRATALKTGALCLDGVAPGYYYRPGSGVGKRSWIVFLRGGEACSGVGKRSWIVFLRGGEACATEKDCYLRSLTTLGTLNKARRWRKLGGIMSADKQLNPEFHNWNSVSLIYCDGFSFAGDRRAPMLYNGTQLYSRGRRVLDAIFTELLRSGMAAAERVILFGHSAGGLGVLLNSHRLRRLLPAGVDVKLLVCSILQPKFPQGAYSKGFKKFLENTAKMHNASGALPSDCVRNYPSKEHACLLPYNLVPLQPAAAFYVSAVFDRWSLEKLLRIRCLPSSCGEFKKEKLHSWSSAMTKQVPRMLKPNDGIFLVNCVMHTFAMDDGTWFSMKVGEKSIAEAFGDWYFGRGDNHTHMDCASVDCYPNPTCIY
ncbi:NOTUM [Branchiostoma lanceolatum]|uniref:NOTUM protein n=1 Tax=Branchiostoma lanceolatum TaxID=7740 RepID=A0A8J9V6R0_BRALA|nr:NOTUM [Branchiostoma lanceolatum]